MGVFVVICWLLFFMLLVFVRKGRQTGFDQWVAQRVSKIPGEKSWQLIALISEPWLLVLYTLILAASFLIKGNYWTAFSVLLTVGLTDALGIIIKHLTGRQRPHTNSSKRTGYSFPSGHVLGISSLGLIICHLYLQSWVPILTVLVWILVVVSRLKLNVHYFSDIMGSVLLAVASYLSISCFLF